MIDMINSVTVTRTGFDIMSQGDHAGQLFTFGKILLLRKDHCIVLVSAGPQAGKKVSMPLVFPATIDGTIYHVDVPEVAAPAADAPVKAPKGGWNRTGPTKISLCRAIFAANKDLDKDAMIAKFVADAGCTPAGAVTYYITCRKG